MNASDEPNLADGSFEVTGVDGGLSHVVDFAVGLGEGRKSLGVEHQTTPISVGFADHFFIFE